MPHIPEYFKNYKAKPDESLYEHTSQLLANLNKLKSLYSIPYYNLIESACIYHDIGKMNSYFSHRLITKEKFDEDREISHNILSFYLFNYLKELPDFKADDFNIVAYSILNHHYYVDNFKILGDDDKSDIIQANLNTILNSEDGANFEVKSFGRKLSKIAELNHSPNEKLIMVKGLLHKCDYSASSHTEIERGTYNLSARMDELNFTWNDMQLFAASKSEDNLILIASTGYGKTEAALKWIGDNKGFYVLPLKTAINSMYFRLRRALFKRDYSDNFALLHGDTQNVYLSQLTAEGKKQSEAEEETGIMDYIRASRAMSLPFTLTTPDQLFRFVFKYPAYEMPLATYSYSKIVIDEIQAYNSRILAFLIYGIRMIWRMGGKTAIVTATLAPFIKDLLLEKTAEYGDENISISEGVFLSPTTRHKVKVYDESLSSMDVANFFRQEKTKKSVKILVVMNTVQDARKIYFELKEELEGEVEIHLIHARFILRDRVLKESQILEDGKFECEKHVIWISTQIVEASLDIDFDYLFTEYAELNSLFQRLGRVNRAGRKRIDIPNAYIYLKIKESYLNHNFIDESLHQLGKKAIKEFVGEAQAYLSEEDKLSLINKAYTMENMLKSDFIKDYRKNYDDISMLEPYSLSILQVEKLFRDIFSVKIIPKTVYEDNRAEIESLESELKNLRKEISKIRKLMRDVEDEEDGKEAAQSLISEKKRLEFGVFEIRDKLNEFSLNVGYFRGIHKSDKKMICGEEIRIAGGSYDFESGFNPELVTEGESIFI